MRPSTDDFDPGKAGLVRLALAAPPLPGTLVQARAIMLDREAATAERVFGMVRHDPVVTAQLLKVANAAHYGSQRTVDTLERAIDLLGPLTVLGVVTGMNVMRGRSALPRSAQACYMRLIRHSIATAHFASLVSRHAGGPRVSADVAYTAGLLHDLGKILLVYHEPARALAIFEEPELLLPEDPTNALEIEQLAFGYDHTEAGEYVARKLDFPDGLVDVIRHHHTPAPSDLPGPSGPIVRVVEGADVAASALGFPFSTVRSWDQAGVHPVWESLSSTAPNDLLDVLYGAAVECESVVDASVRPPVDPPGTHRTPRSGAPSSRSRVD